MKIKAISLKGIGLGFAAVVSMLAIQLIVSSSTFAAVKTWDGGGADDLFSTGANWNGDTAPVTGDSLVFPTVAGGPFVMTNDLNSGGTTFIGVSVTGSTNYSVDSITLSTGSVDVTSTGTFAVTAGLASNGALTLDGNDLLTIGALTVGGDLTVSSPFDATSVDLATTISSMATDFNVTSTLQVDGSLTLSQDITVGTLVVDGNLSVTAPNFQATNGITVGGNLTMSGTPAITTSGPVNVTGDATFTNTFVGTPAINVDGAATISSALTAGAVDVTGVLTAGAAFTASSTSAGSFIVSSSFNGGAITSYASLTTGAFTVTATTLTFPNGSTLTVSSGGTVDASTSITVGNDSADTGAQIVAGAGSTIDTPAITVHGNTGSASTIGGTLTAASNISLPNGSLTLSTASTVGTVNVANALTASNFTATSVTTDTLTISGVFTVTGTLDVNSTSTPLTIGAAIVVGTLDVADDLTVSTGFTANTAVIVGGDLTASAVITNVDTIDVAGNATLNSTFVGSPAPAIDVTGTLAVGANFTAGAVTVGGALTVNNTFTALSLTANAITMNTAFNVTNTLTVATALTVNRAIIVGTLVAQAGLTVSNTFTAPTITVTGNMTSTTTFTATTVTVSGNFTPSADYSATTVNVTGNVTITGSHSSSGHAYVVGGTLTVGNGISSSTAYLATGTNVTGAVTVQDFATLRQVDAATVSLGSLQVDNGGSIYLYGNIAYPVTLGSGKSTAYPTLGYNSFSTTVDGNGDTVYNTLKFNNTVTLANDLILHISGNAISGVIEFTTLNYGGFSILKTSTTQGKLIVGGVEVRNPAVTNEYTGNMPTTSLAVGDNEVAIITGTRDTVTGYRGSFIKGTGRIVNLNLNFGATVSPGNSPGTLTVLENLYFQEGATYYAELQSTAAYDKLAVGEEFVGAGSPVDLNDATLTVVLSEGFKIAQGDKFTIIDNKSDDPITTTFNNLAEGTVFSVADGTFSISYVGGDGNDVVLTVVSAPTPTVQAPNTGFRVLANPAVVLGLGIITAGFFLVMATRRQAQATRY